MNIEVFDRLYREGFQVIPMVPNEKRPAIKEWTKRKIPPSELGDLDPKNIGLRMGDNGLESFDIDSKNSKNPEALKRDFLQGLKLAGITDEMIILQKTVSDGVHILYRTDSPRGNTKIAMSSTNEVLVETRGLGGCIKVYDPAVLDGLANLPLLNKAQRDAIWSIAASFDESISESDGSYASYNDRNSALDILLDHGWSEVERNGQIVKVLRPDNPTSSSSGSVYLDSNRAYIFSTSAGLPTEKLLTPSALTCHLDYKGNWSTFSRSLTASSAPTYTQTATENPWPETPLTLAQLLEKGASLPPTVGLLGSLIFDGEFTILFGRTNVGKTTVAIQIASAIAKGEGLWGLQNEAGPKNVLYMDFEHSLRQVTKRFGAGFQSPKNLFYELTPEFDTVEDIEKWSSGILSSIEERALACSAELVFIDNLSALQSDSSKAEDAVELVRKIKLLKEKLGITIVVIGHPTKQPKEIPMDINQLSGSSKLAALADAVFAMNFSNEGPNSRYIMSLKVRSSEVEYGANNVIKVELDGSKGYPELLSAGFGQEWELLQANYENREARNEDLIKLKKSGMSVREIANQVGLSSSTVGEIVKGVRPERETDTSDKTDGDQPPFDYDEDPFA